MRFLPLLCLFLIVGAVLGDDTTTAKPDRCSLPMAQGFCKTHIPRLYYNKTMKLCMDFVYGGCGGNENNFETLTECMVACNVKL